MIKQLSILFVLILWGSLLAQENQYPNVDMPTGKISGIPVGWVLAGSNPRDYKISQDDFDPQSGYFSASLKSVVNRPQGYVTLMQTIKSDNFKNKRISFSGFVKAKFVSDRAALWMRVDDVIGRPLSFDNMNNRPIVGNSDWIKYEIVLDVPESSSEISFGVLLDGKGEIWFDNFQFKLAEPGTPVTDQLLNKTKNLDPQNMDFEK